MTNMFCSALTEQHFNQQLLFVNVLSTDILLQEKQWLFWAVLLVLSCSLMLSYEKRSNTGHVFFSKVSQKKNTKYTFDVRMCYCELDRFFSLLTYFTKSIIKVKI